MVDTVLEKRIMLITIVCVGTYFVRMLSRMLENTEFVSSYKLIDA